MKCPHCSDDLLQRQRVGRRCGSCRKDFALDPRIDGRGLNDVRVRRIITRLTGDGGLYATTDQLRHALGFRGRPDPGFKGSKVAAGCLTVVGVVGLFAAFGLTGWLALAVAALAVGLLGLSVHGYRLAETPAPPRVVHPQRSEAEFRRVVLDRWREVYGRLPAKLVDASTVKPAQPVGLPAAALLCPDPTAAACLHANGFPRRHRALLVSSADEVPEGVPVAVLHDASPTGVLLVRRVRAALPGRRVVDGGLPARAVLAAEHRFLVLREPERGVKYQPALADLPGLTPAERSWYADGWWTPLACVPPRQLLAAAERAVRRATAPAPVRRPPAESPAETRRRAASVGFLSWPAATGEARG